MPSDVCLQLAISSITRAYDRAMVLEKFVENDVLLKTILEKTISDILDALLILNQAVKTNSHTQGVTHNEQDLRGPSTSH